LKKALAFRWFSNLGSRFQVWFPLCDLFCLLVLAAYCRDVHHQIKFISNCHKSFIFPNTERSLLAKLPTARQADRYFPNADYTQVEHQVYPLFPHLFHISFRCTLGNKHFNGVL
jgi:hypothetical protein